MSADWCTYFVPTQDGDDASPVLTSCDIVKVPDPQMGMVRGHTHTPTYTLKIQLVEKCLQCLKLMVCLQENLVESKHHKLARSLRSGPSDHDLKPNAATRDQLNVRDSQFMYYFIYLCSILKS